MAVDDLEKVRQMLEPDGYDIAERPGGETRVFEIIAKENACADCLVPKEAMRRIIALALGIGGEQIDITYPTGSYHET
jgi:hypothetical protein